MVISLAILFPIPANMVKDFQYQIHLKFCVKNLLSFFISLPNGAKANSKLPIMIPMRALQPPRFFTTLLEIICGNNKASSVNMLVIFYGKLECRFLTVTISFCINIFQQLQRFYGLTYDKLQKL